MNKYTRHFILFACARGISLLVLFLNSALIGRILGANGFGQWTMIVAASTMLHNVFFNWTYASGLRFGCEEWVKDGSLSRTWAARYPLLLIGLLITLLLLVLQPMNWLNSLFSLHADLWWLVLAFALSLWITFEMQTALQASGRMTLLALFTPVTALFTLIFLSSLIIFPSSVKTPVWVVSGQVTITFFVCAALLLQGQKKPLFRWRSPDAAEIKRHVRYGWPLLPTFLVGYVSMWGNYSILQAYHSSREVGLFGAAYQIMLGVISLNGILITIVLPRLIAKNTESRQATREYFINVVPTLFCLWALATIALIAVIPSVFILLFGSQFTESRPILLILFAVIPTSILPHVYTVLFNIQQRLSRELFYSFIGMLGCLIVSFCLIPVIGGRGAAAGVIAALLISQVYTMWDQHRFMKVPLRRMGILYSATLSLSVLQCAAGGNILARLVWSGVSICVLILLFRKLRTVNPDLLNIVFSGRLSRIGGFLKKVLVPAL